MLIEESQGAPVAGLALNAGNSHHVIEVLNVGIEMRCLDAICLVDRDILQRAVARVVDDLDGLDIFQLALDVVGRAVVVPAIAHRALHGSSAELVAPQNQGAGTGATNSLITRAVFGVDSLPGPPESAELLDATRRVL